MVLLVLLLGVGGGGGYEWSRPYIPVTRESFPWGSLRVKRGYCSRMSPGMLE